MGLSNGVLIVSGKQDVAEAIRQAIATHPRFGVHGSVREMIGLAASLDVAEPAAVVIDIDPDPVRILDSIAPLAEEHDQIRFIVVSDAIQGEHVLRAMQVGARHYLLKASISTELGPTLERLVPASRTAQERTSTIVTVLGAGGGCGATTLAINLANELRLETGNPALLIDLDRSYAAVASYLGLDGRYGVAEVLDHGDRLDGDLIKSTALRYTDGLDVLISNSVLGPGEPMAPALDNLRSMIDATSTTYDAVVIDASRVPAATVVPLIDPSAATLMLLQLNVVHLRMAKSMLSALSEHGVPASAVIPVASHYHRRRSVITLADAQRALYDRPLGTLSLDEASAAAGSNYGQPLAECAPRSTLRKEIRAFAERVLASRKQNVSLAAW